MTTTVERLTLTPREVARALACDVQRVYELIRTGEMPSFKLGVRDHRVAKEGLQRFIRRRSGMDGDA